MKDDGIIKEMGSQDVVIRGANALDPYGVAGVMMAHLQDGITGSSIGTIMAKGINLVIPVGMMPLIGTVVTEVQALTLLGAQNVFPIGAGGINGGEGSVTLGVIGERTDEIFELVQKVKEKKAEL